MTYRILTAGASDARGTMAKPAARTAADWTKAAAIRVPTGISSIALTIRLVRSHTRGGLRSSNIKDQETDPIKQSADQLSSWDMNESLT
jgi:hypothetical protein